MTAQGSALPEGQPQEGQEEQLAAWGAAFRANVQRARAGHLLDEGEIVQLVIALGPDMRSGLSHWLWRTPAEILHAVMSEEADPDVPLDAEGAGNRLDFARRVLDLSEVVQATRRAVRTYALAGRDISRLANLFLVLSMEQEGEAVLATMGQEEGVQ